MTERRGERGLDNSASTAGHNNKDEDVDWLCCACNMDLHSEAESLGCDQCRIAARAECAIAQGPDLLGGPVGPPTSAYLHESMALKPE